MLETASDLSHQLEIARNEIKNLRQQINNLKHSYKKDVDDIKRLLENTRITEVPNPGASQIACKCEFAGWQSIGSIETWFSEKRGVPRQAGICPDAEAVVTLSSSAINNPSYALQGLEEFSHFWILFHFHQTDAVHVRTKVAPPRMDGAKIGVFATRAPHRPCPIGLSLVKLNKVEGNKIYFTGVDMLDGTPVLDIKPFIPQYDSVQHFSPDNIQPPCNRLVEGDHLVTANNEIHTANSNESQAVQKDTLMTSSPDPSVKGIGEKVVTNEVLRSTSDANEREDPEGEEQDVQVASWVANPPRRNLEVVYTERASGEIASLSEGTAVTNTITQLLQQDPRSTYLRQKLGSQFYTFRIESLHVTVKFDDSIGVVTVMFVQPVSNIET